MESIQKIELILNEDYFEFNETITQRYWNIKNNVFFEKPTEIAKGSEFTFSDITRLASNSGYVQITGSCINCKEYFTLNAFSQSQAKRILAPLWICDNCANQKEKREELRRNEEAESLLKYRVRKFEYAQENQTWKEFSLDELEFILQMLEANSVKAIIWNVIQNERKKWSILYKAEKFCLADLLKDERDYIIDIYFLENLKEEILSYIKTLKVDSITQKPSNPMHPELGFKLLKNPRIITEDDAAYYGDVSFDRDIILKANTLYAYSVWPRDNGDKWISITPSDNILKSKNHHRPNGPQHIGDIIKKWKY